MSELSFHIQIRRKGNWFIASAPELDFISQGQTIEQAKKNLLEVIQIQFEEMREMGTLEEYLTECVDDQGGILRASSEGIIHNLT